ncbi:MAG: alpha-L-arabinofuranosidase C-terminal domain-containing protein [Anaerolineae bacterium]
MRDLDPQTGADMVHYLNNPPTTELGQLRAANGHPEPYNVKYFMLGNEVWWPYTEFDLSADRIVKQTVAFAQAMKTADPTIQIVFNPVNDAFPESFLRTDDPVQAPIIQKLGAFNEEIIPRTREYVDAVEFFQYGLAVGDGTVLPELDEEGWKYVMAHAYVLDKYDNADRHRAIADQYGPDTALIMGEFSGPAARLGGAIYDADYMIYLLNHAYDVFVSNWNLGLIETNYYGLIKQDVFQERPPVRRPSFYVQKMFNNYFGDTIVATEIADSPTFDVQERDTGEYLALPAAQNVPSLNAIATTGDGKLYLMIVNRDLERDIEINVELNGFSPATEATVYVLNGPAIDATNEENPENVTMREERLAGIADSFFYTVEKYSVTLITLTSAQK